MIGEFQPDLRLHWVKNNDGVWEPDINAKTGLQVVVPQATYHQLVWPGDSSVSSISDKSWFNMTKGWDDKINPVSGHIWFIGEARSTAPVPGKGEGPYSPRYIDDEDFTLVQDVRWTKMPAGTVKISVMLNPHWHPVGYGMEVRAA